MKNVMSQNKNYFGAWGVAQMVECLPSKHKALSLTPVPLKTKTKTPSGL
jgi:hypothetical protein